MKVCPLASLSPFGQATAVTQQLGSLAFTVDVSEGLAQFGVCTGLASAVRGADLGGSDLIIREVHETAELA